MFYPGILVKRLPRATTTDYRGRINCAAGKLRKYTRDSIRLHLRSLSFGQLWSGYTRAKDKLRK